MMASLVINSIRSALERSDNTHNDFEVLITKRQLKNLELFVLCARKLGDDAELRFDDGKVSTLGSLLQRIHDAVAKLSRDPSRKIFVYPTRAIANFIKEIGRWYNILLISPPQPTLDEVTEIIDSVLDNLDVILHRYPWVEDIVLPPMKAMIEKITFLRNFIRFATLRSVEPRQLLDKLLVHIQAVAVYVAHTSYICVAFTSYMCLARTSSVGRCSMQKVDMEPNIPVLLQMIKMVDPQVDEICTQVLISSKLSTKLLSPRPDKDHDTSVIMKDFIDSLMWNLWENLYTDTPIVISTNSELQLVYEGLRLLRIMLNEQPNKFDKKIGELICDAGAIIFSLYQKDREIFVLASDLMQIVKIKEFSILDLLQRISRIRQKVKGKDLSTPDLPRRIHGAREQVGGNDLPRTNELGFIDFVLENLLGMTSSKACHGLHSQFQMIRDELSSLRYSLGEIEEVRNEQKDLENLCNAGAKVAYKVEFVIDQLVFGDFQGSSSTSFDSIAEDILKEVKSINSNIHRAFDIKVKEVSMPPNPVPAQNRAPVAHDIVGFDDDITSIIGRLTRGSKQLKMVAIVGMPGIGKTTLATKVFNHRSVTFHFPVHLQYCVSQSFDKKKLLLELCKQVDPNTNIEKIEYDLADQLRRHLKGKRYLIFLDDVWDIEAWDSLNISFPNDSNGSRILVTSRHRGAVPEGIHDDDIFFLRELTDEQSWELLRKKLPPRNDWPMALCKLGKQIAANCKGLPLMIVVVAGLLANMEPQGWKLFEKSIISSFSGANHCKNILELSYKHLPGHLKQCFLYFGLFPEGDEVSVKRLIRLWIAEGFVRKTESKRLEDTGRDYLMDLVGRSLVIVSKERSRGGVKACRIHDLLHDFCRTKANDENFFQVLKGYDELLSFEEHGYKRRLCVHSEKIHFKNLRLFYPLLHSLLFFPHDEERRDYHDISFIILRYRRLRVLDIGQYHVSSWIGIPSEIGFLLQLKYLSVSGDISDIPSSIGSLTNLETLILYSNHDKVSLPDTFWNLQKLRHLDIPRGFRLAFENLENFPDLYELQSCSSISIGGRENIERLVRKFPNIRKLRCWLDLDFVDLGLVNSNEIEIFKLISLSQLESLKICHRSLHRFSWQDVQLEFDFPCNLRKLSLSMSPKDDILLRQSDVSRIGKLSNLEVLKFVDVNFEEDTWELGEGEFSTLRFLELTNSKIVRWTALDDHEFPSLEKLVLRSCTRLEEIGCCFATLEMVQVTNCGEYVNSFFKAIEELGNSCQITNRSYVNSNQVMLLFRETIRDRFAGGKKSHSHVVNKSSLS